MDKKLRVIQGFCKILPFSDARNNQIRSSTYLQTKLHPGLQNHLRTLDSKALIMLLES